jgi:hypothetical protein
MSIKIHGKTYVEVKDRILAFRNEHKDWNIQTNVINFEPKNGVIIMKASVVDDTGVVKATGHAHEWQGDKSSMVNETSFVENCETSAIGRALGLLGYGIEESFASADEIRIAENKKNKIPNQAKPKIDKSKPETHWANAIIPIGKNKGKTLGELTAKQRQWYLDDYEANEDYPDSLAFRKACDDCIAETNAEAIDFNMKMPKVNEDVPDEIAEQTADPDLDEDVPF